MVPRALRPTASIFVTQISVALSVPMIAHLSGGAAIATCFAYSDFHGYDLVGFALAFATTGYWAVYILLTRSVAARKSGIEGLSLSLGVAFPVSLSVCVVQP